MRRNTRLFCAAMMPRRLVSESGDGAVSDGELLLLPSFVAALNALQDDRVQVPPPEANVDAGSVRGELEGLHSGRNVLKDEGALSDFKDEAVRLPPQYCCDAGDAERGTPLGELPRAEGERAERMLRAWSLIDQADPALGRTMRGVIVAIVTLPEDDDRPEGFSRSDAVGVVWVRPASMWDDFDFACTLVHECAHSAIHLDEMVTTLYAVEREALDETLAHSSIRGRSRPYDKALHAAVVSACLARFCELVAESCSGVLEQKRRHEVAEHIRDVERALPSLIEGKFCLAPAGLVYLRELNDLASAAVSPAMPLRRGRSQSQSVAALAVPELWSAGLNAVQECTLRFAAANIAGYGGCVQALHGERKVLNKYFPPDFDHTKIPRRKMDPLRVMKIRMMLPMSICCSTCNNYMYAGTKFNSKKEDVQGPEGRYLGIKIFRFTIKCTVCSAACCFVTDPKNGDYQTESGCTRNFEAWREKEKVEEELVKEKEADEEGDAMRALEARTADSKNEMDILDALDEMRAQNARHEQVDVDNVLDAVQSRRERKAPEDIEAAAAAAAAADEEDEELVRKNFTSARAVADDSSHSSSGDSDNDGDAPHSKSLFQKPALLGAAVIAVAAKKAPAAFGGAALHGQKKRGAPALPGVVVKKAKPVRAAVPAAAPAVSGALGGLSDYGSASSSNSDDD